MSCVTVTSKKTMVMQNAEVDMETDKLYKVDSHGNTRVWWIEYEADRYRTHSGLEDGQVVISGWKYPVATNVGRSNERSVSEQVAFEVEAEYTKKQNQGKYHRTKEQSVEGAKFIECMLASKYDPDKHKAFPYFSQPKLDGVRCLVSKNGMQSRNGKPILSAPHIRKVLEPFFQLFPEVVLDGELYNHELKNDFEKIISLARKSKPTEADLEESSKMIQYHVYDVILENEECHSRLAFLENYINERFEPIVKMVASVPVFKEETIGLFLSQYLEDGYEGQMIRVPSSIYEGKRSKFLLKHKEFEDAEFPIVSIIEGKGNWAGYAKSVRILLPDGTTQESGVRGDQNFLRSVLDNYKEYIGTEVTVRYQNKTVDGKLRFPVVVAFWKGKRDL